MISRGDLAVDCGYQKLAQVQQEILWVCEAAHVPVISATQVLESLVKAGVPSRSEITDAAAGEQPECVILSKAPILMPCVRCTTFGNAWKVTSTKTDQLGASEMRTIRLNPFLP